MDKETHEFRSTEEALHFIADQVSTLRINLSEVKNVVTLLAGISDRQGVSLRPILRALADQEGNRFAQHILDGLNGLENPKDQGPSRVHLKVVKDEE